MAECRFFPECARCNEIGDSWFPCEGGADGMRCADYAPMPDVDALLKLADDVIKEAERKELSCYDRGVATVGTRYVRGISRRIREALGVES